MKEAENDFLRKKRESEKMEKEQVVCDFTTGICGPADEHGSEGVIEFIDLTPSEEVEEEKNEG